MSLSHDFKIWPITFQASGPSRPILLSHEKSHFNKKYSNIHHLRKLGVEEWIVRLVQGMYANVRSRVRVGEGFSKDRVATVREKVLENEIFSRSGENQGITFSVREI